MMKAVLQIKPGGADTLYIGDAPKPSPLPRELLIRVKATALNRADIMQREGKYPPPAGTSSILGLEISGTVESVGSEVLTSEWNVGDCVCALLPGGGYAEYVTIPADMAIRVPEKVSLIEAATLPEAFLTAWQALSWIAGLKENQTVLIHAGASGVGSSAIQIVKQFAGTKIIVTVGSQEKIDYCIGLGAAVGFNRKDGDWALKVDEYTAGAGVDIIIDFVGADYWEANLRSLAIEGTMVMLAYLSGTDGPIFDMSPFLRKRITVTGSTLRARSLDYKVKLTKSLETFLLPHLLSGSIKPVVYKVFDWHNIAEAHSVMEANTNLGKIVLEISKE